MEKKVFVRTIVLFVSTSSINTFGAEIESPVMWKTSHVQLRSQYQQRLAEVSTSLDAQELINSRHTSLFQQKSVNKLFVPRTSSTILATQLMQSPCRPAGNGYFGSTPSNILPSLSLNAQNEIGSQIKNSDSTKFSYSYELETSFIQEENGDALVLLLRRVHDGVMDALLSGTFPSVCAFDSYKQSGYNEEKFSQERNGTFAAGDRARPYTVTGFWFDFEMPGSRKFSPTLKVDNFSRR